MFKKEKPVAYLAGPITGYENQNRKIFRHHQRRVEEKGYKAIVPHDLFIGIDTTKYSYGNYMRRCVHALLDADVLIPLPNWRSSRGAKLEVHIAQKLGIKIDWIYTLEDLSVEEKKHPLSRVTKYWIQLNDWLEDNAGWFFNPEKNYKNQTIER